VDLKKSISDNRNRNSIEVERFLDTLAQIIDHLIPLELEFAATILEELYVAETKKQTNKEPTHLQSLPKFISKASCNVLGELFRAKQGFFKCRFITPNDIDRTLLSRYVDESLCVFVPRRLYTLFVGREFPTYSAAIQQAKTVLLLVSGVPARSSLNASIGVETALESSFGEDFWDHWRTLNNEENKTFTAEQLA
jgi:hypothetical protein